MRQGGQIRIEVQDNGPGMLAEERVRAFERFFRGQGSWPWLGLGAGHRERGSPAAGRTGVPVQQRWRAGTSSERRVARWLSFDLANDCSRCLGRPQGVASSPPRTSEALSSASVARGLFTPARSPSSPASRPRPCAPHRCRRAPLRCTRSASCPHSVLCPIAAMRTCSAFICIKRQTDRTVPAPAARGGRRRWRWRCAPRGVRCR